jgi:hypothetical protein
MRTSSKLLLGALTAAAFLSFAVNSASARRIAILHFEEGFSFIWVPLEFIGNGGTVRCNVTVEGSFHSGTISKVSGLLIGYVTRAILTNCVGGTAAFLPTTLPWHVRYLSFGGALPAIERITIAVTGAGFKTKPTGALVECLALTSAANPARLILIVTEEPVFILWDIGNLRADETAEIPLTGTGCTGNMRLRELGLVLYLRMNEFLRILLVR